jgi:hypothetical protein
MRTLSISEINHVCGADAGDAAAAGGIVGGIAGANGGANLARLAWGGRAIASIMLCGSMGLLVGAALGGVAAYYIYMQAMDH